MDFDSNATGRIYGGGILGGSQSPYNQRLDVEVGEPVRAVSASAILPRIATLEQRTALSEKQYQEAFSKFDARLRRIEEALGL